MTNTRGNAPIRSGMSGQLGEGEFSVPAGVESTSGSRERPLRVRSAAALAATVPYILGFQPDESLVITFFDRRGRLRLTGRFELSGGGCDIKSIADVMSDQLVPGESVAVHLAAFTRHADSAADVLDALRALCRSRRVRLLGAGIVEDNRWRPLTTSGGVEEPGQSLDEGEALDAVCEMVLSGRSFVANRSEIVRMVTGVEEIRDSVERELVGLRDGCGQPGATGISDGGPAGARQRRELEDSILAYFGGRRGAPGPRELAEWAVGLGDSRVREPVLWRLSPASPDEGLDHSVEEIVSAWTWLIRATPAPMVAPMAAALAAFAWQSGNGVLARISASHALDADPTSRLGRLVIRAMNRSTSPSVWIDLMRSMTVDELRGCRI